MVTIAWQRAAAAVRGLKEKVDDLLQNENEILQTLDATTTKLEEQTKLCSQANTLLLQDKAVIEGALSLQAAAEKKAEGFFSSIATIEKERDEAFRLYHLSSAQMAVAQGMMMRELERLYRILGKTPEERLQRLRDEYAKEHAPAIEKGMALMKPEPAPDGAPALAESPPSG